ncbi:hypothetical protein ES708_30325 [subsurface metagenome]
MRKAYFLVILLLILAIFLTGCGGLVTPVTDEAKVKEVIQGFWSALSNKQFELAKTYCVPYGDAYYAVEDYQILSDYDYVTINWTPCINWIKIIGNKATVNMTITLDGTVCFEGFCSSQNETLHNYSMYLIKSYGDWKMS